MKRRNKDKKKTYGLLLLLMTIAIGIGYATLFELLEINSTVKIGSIKWDVGFKTAVDAGGTVESNPTISQDKKTITLACNLGNETSASTCIANVIIENNSTFAAKLSEEPIMTYENTYIDSAVITWTSNSEAVVKEDTIDAGETKEIQIKITTKELTKDILPTTSLSIPVTITLNWIEGDAVVEEVPEREGYERVQLDLTPSAFYNSAKTTYAVPPELITAETNKDGNEMYFWATQVFTKDTLPNGSIIVLADGWQYRPEGWDAENIQLVESNERPANVKTAGEVIVDDTWWGTFTARGFNIALVGNKTDISGYTEDQINEAFKIYIPISE